MREIREQGLRSKLKYSDRLIVDGLSLQYIVIGGQIMMLSDFLCEYIWSTREKCPPPRVIVVSRELLFMFGIILKREL
jgi:hypothetical protein